MKERSLSYEHRTDLEGDAYLAMHRALVGEGAIRFPSTHLRWVLRSLLTSYFRHLRRHQAQREMLHDERSNETGLTPEEITILRAQIVRARQVLSSVTASRRLVVLLTLDQEILATYYQPGDPLEALTAAIQEALHVDDRTAHAKGAFAWEALPLDDAQIADLLHITVNNVWVLRHRLRQRLQRELDP